MSLTTDHLARAGNRDGWRELGWLLPFIVSIVACVTSSPSNIGASCTTDGECDSPLMCRDGICAAHAASEDATAPSSSESQFRGPPQTPTTRTGGGASTAIPGNSCVRAPLDDYSPYGWEENVPAYGGLHLGEDSVAGPGTPVYAVATGPVTYSDNRRPDGRVCCDRTGCATNWGGLVYQNVTVAGVTVTIAYGHLDPTALPRAGQVVNRGERIGVVADCSQTGFFTHLHVQVTTDGRTLSMNSAATLGGYEPTSAGWQPFTPWAQRIAALPQCSSSGAPSRPVLVAPPNNAPIGEGANVTYVWENNGAPDPLVFTWRRCLTPGCSGIEDGPVQFEPASGGRRTMALAAGEYRWTVYHEDPRCAPDGRCAAAARLVNVQPRASVCGDGRCDAAENCGSCSRDCRCACTPRSTEACVADARGACASGRRTCDSSGTWGGCLAGSPRSEACNGQDDDCDGATDEDGVCRPACACASGVCCDGCNLRPATASCAERTETRCNGAIGGAIEQRRVRTMCSGAGSDCSGAATADAWVLVRRCGASERCEGVVPTCASLTCAPGATMSCGSGRSGICAEGRQSCNSSGGWDACTAVRSPTAEICNGLDDDCDGATDEDGVCGPRTCRYTFRDTGGTSFFTMEGPSGSAAVGTEVSCNLRLVNSSSTRSIHFTNGSISRSTGTSVEVTDGFDSSDGVQFDLRGAGCVGAAT